MYHTRASQLRKPPFIEEVLLSFSLGSGDLFLFLGEKVAEGRMRGYFDVIISDTVVSSHPTPLPEGEGTVLLALLNDDLRLIRTIDHGIFR